MTLTNCHLNKREEKKKVSDEPDREAYCSDGQFKSFDFLIKTSISLSTGKIQRKKIFTEGLH